MNIDLPNSQNLDTDIRNIWSNDIFQNSTYVNNGGSVDLFSNATGSTMPLKPTFDALSNMLTAARTNNARVFYFGQNGAMPIIKIEGDVDVATNKYGMYADLAVTPFETLEALVKRFYPEAAASIPQGTITDVATPRIRPTIDASQLSIDTINTNPNSGKQNLPINNPSNPNNPNNPSNPDNRGNDDGGFTQDYANTRTKIPKAALIGLGVLALIIGGSFLYKRFHKSNTKIPTT